MQKPLNRNVFVDIFPMNAYTVADKAPILPFCGGGIFDSRTPFKRHGYLSAVSQNHTKVIVAETDVNTPDPQNRRHKMLSHLFVLRIDILSRQGDAIILGLLLFGYQQIVLRL